MRIIIIVFFIFYFEQTNAQCHVTAFANGDTTSVEICVGQGVTLTSVGGCPTFLMYNDFNDATAGLGWQATNQAMFNNPCAPHSPDGTIYMWMGSTSTAPRILTTIPFDVSQGGTIEFEMRYALQAAASPCEGPDLYQEGVSLQYSINNGTSWNDIVYFAPNGDILTTTPTATTPGIGTNAQTIFTVWGTYTYPIPPAAQTTATRFRWAQLASTSAAYDHWGLDNVIISVPPPNIDVWWSHGPTVFNPPAVYPTQNTTYTVYLTNGTTTVQSSVNVIVNPIPTSNFSIGTACINEPVTITYTGNATSGAVYDWNFGTGTVISGTGQGPYQIVWQTPGAHLVSLSVSYNNCVSNVTTQQVTIHQKPNTPNISYNNPCFNDNLNLLADNVQGASYFWSGPFAFTSNQQNPVIQNANFSHQGTYYLYISDANGCISDTTSLPVIINSLPDVSFIANPLSGCMPLTVYFNNNSQNHISSSWNFGDAGAGSTNVSPVYTYNHSGLYSVSLTVTDANGCENTLTQQHLIEVYPNPVADFYFTPNIGSIDNATFFFQDQSQLAVTWHWNFGNPAAASSNTSSLPSAFHYYDEGIYTVTLIVTSVYGCVDSISKDIVIQPPLTFYIPNTFTPNGDGNNEYFQGYGLNIVGYEMYIFSRWGELIFKTDDYNVPWDGRDPKTNLECPQGVYVYKFIVTHRNGKTKEYHGNIFLMR